MKIPKFKYCENRRKHFICEQLGKPGRYHPTERCRNKNKNIEIKSVNNLEMEKNLIWKLPIKKTKSDTTVISTSCTRRMCETYS